MSGLAVLAQAWEAAGRPVGWECSMLGHDFGGRARSNCDEFELKRRVSVLTVCRLCEEVVCETEEFSMYEHKLDETIEQLSRQAERRCVRRLLERDRNERNRRWETSSRSAPWSPFPVR